jgi:hypothetical protein
VWIVRNGFVHEHSTKPRSWFTPANRFTKPSAGFLSMGLFLAVFMLVVAPFGSPN